MDPPLCGNKIGDIVHFADESILLHNRNETFLENFK